MGAGRLCFPLPGHAGRALGPQGMKARIWAGEPNRTGRRAERTEACAHALASRRQDCGPRPRVRHPVVLLPGFPLLIGVLACNVTMAPESRQANARSEKTSVRAVSERGSCLGPAAKRLLSLASSPTFRVPILV
jgi:hypothetical protein